MKRNISGLRALRVRRREPIPLRAAAKKLGLRSAGHLSEIERGIVTPSDAFVSRAAEFYKRSPATIRKLVLAACETARRKGQVRRSAA